MAPQHSRQAAPLLVAAPIAVALGALRVCFIGQPSAAPGTKPLVHTALAAQDGAIGQPLGEPTAQQVGAPTASCAAFVAAAAGVYGLRRASSVALRNTGCTTIAAEAGEVPAAKQPAKKVRITAFDSVRFFLIAYIVCGHFITFAEPSKFAFQAMTQVNVVVGAFFALSGYVAAYTTTENQQREPSAKLLSTPKPEWILQRVFGYFPLHLLMCVLFMPMFLYPDVLFSGWPTALGHGAMALTMTQAWFPMHAEIWNAPTWFLGALTFATAVLPFALPTLARQNKKTLRRSFAILFLVGLLPKLGYCYDHNAWGFLEGAMAPKSMPNLAMFNMQRFNPFFATVEVLLGAVACRLVMLDDALGETPAPKVNTLSTLLPVVGMVGIVLLRATGVVALSDLLTRALIFMPLFLRFMMAAHRASVLPKVVDPLCNLLSKDLLVTLGNLAFPIFVVHGPLGQLFYKKIIATKVFGATMNALYGPGFFYAYLGIVVGFAWVVQKTFLTNKSVGSLSKKAVEKLCSFF